jgi:putative sporulation protein YtxC
MELFRISTMNATKEKMSILYKEINQELSHLHTHQYAKKINLIIQSSELCCIAQYPHFQLKRDAEPIYNKVSKGIAEYVMKEIEQPMIRQLIKIDHKEYDKHEISSIEKYCIQMINQSSLEDSAEDARFCRKQKLADAFEQYLLQHTYLNIEGFIHFRLADYKEDLREVVEYAVDEFVMDKQYQEFISLLKYFVYVQDTKIPEVHIIHKKGSDFMILNDELKPMENKKVEGFVVEMIDKDINYEDMIVSTLISISPKKVYIHTREKELQVIKTIQQIFEDRTELCEDCHICHPVLEKYSLDR